MGDDEIKAGLYIGHGPKPSNVTADAYVDMNGKDVGVYIGGTPAIEELFERVVQENPGLSKEISALKDEYMSSNDKKSVLEKIVDFGKNNPQLVVGAMQLLINVANQYLSK